MELSIDVITDGYCKDCKVIVKDTSKYVEESNGTVAKDKFKYSETVSIFILQHNKSTETVYGTPIFVKHDTNEFVEIPVQFDGWFTVIEIVLPTKAWYDSNKTAVDLYNVVYYSDGNDIYKHVKGQDDAQVTLEEVLELNPVDVTVYKTAKDYVSICYLRKCYIHICQEIFNQRGFSSACLQKSNVDSELIFKRDIVWMAINVIKYLTECEQLAEVERIIETLTQCNGLCPSNTKLRKTNGCGCG